VPTNEEIRAAFAEQRESIEYDEKYLVRFIRQFLLTDVQKERIAAWNIDVADLVNGRYPIRYSDEVRSWRREWNQSLGERRFLE